jgi:trans-2,3-dihydro-3-hydroxyanthranilate isomerase
MPYRFYTCDVFTDSRFGGNPLAVLPDASGLTTEQMQLIAREFNYSESTFVLPAQHDHTRQVRIFTTDQEVPFAGHPNVGTAFVLATIGELGDFDTTTEITFEEKAGLVPITIRREPGQPIWCELKAPEPLSLGQTFPDGALAAVLSLTPDDIVVQTHAPQVASVGLPFIITELKDRGALARARINHEALATVDLHGTHPFFHLYAKSSGDFDLYSRMFAVGGDTTFEDPATGSANCALVGMLGHYQPEENGRFSYRIAQGVEMGRPSVLNGRCQKQAGTVTGVWMAGTSVLVSEGYIHI